MDVFTREKRSAIMAAIKGRGAVSTEVAVRTLLKRCQLKGWRSHLNSLPGRPDFAFPTENVAVFVDGCFWHGCRTCTKGRRPAVNAAFWHEKISGNIRRDRRVARALRKRGWTVVRIWEHSVEKEPGRVARRLLKAVARSRVP